MVSAPLTSSPWVVVRWNNSAGSVQFRHFTSNRRFFIRPSTLNCYPVTAIGPVVAMRHRYA